MPTKKELQEENEKLKERFNKVIHRWVEYWKDKDSYIDGEYEYSCETMEDYDIDPVYLNHSYEGHIELITAMLEEERVENEELKGKQVWLERDAKMMIPVYEYADDLWRDNITETKLCCGEGHEILSTLKELKEQIDELKEEKQLYLKGLNLTHEDHAKEIKGLTQEYYDDIAEYEPQRIKLEEENEELKEENEKIGGLVISQTDKLKEVSIKYNDGYKINQELKEENEKLKDGFTKEEASKFLEENEKLKAEVEMKKDAWCPECVLRDLVENTDYAENTNAELTFIQYIQKLEEEIKELKAGGLATHLDALKLNDVFN